MINAVLVDDHELVRVGFRKIIEETSDIRIVGEAEDAESGLRLVRGVRPDVALIDLHMDGMSGLALTERVTRHGSSTRVVVLTMVDSAGYPRRLMDAGAMGYLTKDCAATDLVTAIRRAASGQRFLTSGVAESMAFSMLDGHVSPVDVLSAREMEVAMMLVKGRSLIDIGAYLNVSPKTVSTYKQRLMDKLEVRHLVDLVRLMLSHEMTGNEQARHPVRAVAEGRGG